MASKSYSAAERGGGTGDTGRMRAAILNHISTWWNQAKWVDEEKADRIFDKMQEAPEQFINPNPDTCGSYQEEAKRCYDQIKDDYSLKTKGELEKLKRDYEERAEAHARKKRREIEAQQEQEEPEPEPEPEEPEPEPEEPEPEPEPTPELPVATLAGIVLAAGFRTLLAGAWRGLRWLIPRLAGATKRTAYAAGVAVGWAVRATVALALVVLASCYRFGEGFGRAVVGGGSV
jgi:hypothetical protein